jgi:large subunit ribosomal protein L21
MYAVIRAGGKQFRVTPGDVIQIEKSAGAEGKIQFGGADVLAVSTEAGKIAGGNGATVTAQIIGEQRGDKVLVFKFKRKKQYKRMQGHRQNYASVRITEIAVDGQKFSADGSVSQSKRSAKREKSLLDSAAQAVGTVAGVAAGVADAVSKSASAKGKKAAGKKPAAKKSAAKKSSKKK